MVVEWQGPDIDEFFSAKELFKCRGEPCSSQRATGGEWEEAVFSMH